MDPAPLSRAARNNYRGSRPTTATNGETPIFEPLLASSASRHPLIPEPNFRDRRLVVNLRGLRAAVASGVARSSPRSKPEGPALYWRHELVSERVARVVHGSHAHQKPNRLRKGNERPPADAWPARPPIDCRSGGVNRQAQDGGFPGPAKGHCRKGSGKRKESHGGSG